MQKAIFFDRDGVVNIDKGYVYKIADFEYVSGFVEFFTLCKNAGFLAFIITNQSGINRGFYTQNDFQILCDFMQNDLMQKCGFVFDKIYFCPHTPQENCHCRKPRTKMIENAMSDFSIDLEQSFFIGDKQSDMECALNAGIKKRILFSSDKEISVEISNASFVIDNFHKAHSIII